MIPSQSIYQRCKEYNVPCLIIEDANHADIFLLNEFRDVWNTIKTFLNFDV